MNIFNISHFKPPPQLIVEFNNVSHDNYEWIYEDHELWKKQIKENPITELTSEEFESLHKTTKKMCFILYLLYLRGGIYCDLNVIPTNEVNTVDVNNIDFVCVKSVLGNGSLFTGIIGSRKHSSFNLKLIKKICELPKETEIDITKFMFEAVTEFLKHDNLENFKIKMYNEMIFQKECVATVDENNSPLFNNYFNNKYYYKFNVIPKHYNTISSIKIGITLIIFPELSSFFSNGINQNSLYLGELFVNCGFDVYFIVQDEKLKNVTEENLKKELYDSRFKITRYSEILFANFDLIVTLSFSYTDKYLFNNMKHMGTKHVGYFCGNSYLIDSEKILFNQHLSRQSDKYDFCFENESKYDEIWSIPQMTELNLHYWEILYRCKCVEVPFVWSPNAIKLSAKVIGVDEEELIYKPKVHNGKKVAVFEPNISIMKWALPCAVICEKAYRKNKDIKHLYITNINSSSTTNFNLKQFNGILQTLDIVRDKKCSIESRYNTLEFMRKYSDIALSHQWGNPLNYLYFDLAWMGWPIVHNAFLCSDVGYYYDNFNYEEASNQLINVINNHDNNLNNYIVNNRKSIDRFLSTNKDLQNKYLQLICNILNIQIENLQ